MKYQHQVQQQIHSTADTHDLRCTVCHGVFSSRGDLDSHMLTHTQQKLTSSNNVKHKVSELDDACDIAFITDCVRSTREGYVLTCVCLSICPQGGTPARGGTPAGGYPCQVQLGGTPAWSNQGVTPCWGVPHLRSPHQTWPGVPQPGLL